MTLKKRISDSSCCFASAMPVLLKNSLASTMRLVVSASRSCRHMLCARAVTEGA